MAARNGTSPTISVVVCTRDRPQQLGQCLAALARLEYPAYDVVVVDNAPRNERAQNVALRWGVRYLTEPVGGLSRARNRGARACETEIVAYIDDDAVAEPNWLSALAREFEDPLVAVATGAIRPIRPRGDAAHKPEVVAAGETTRRQRRVVDLATPGWFEIANFGEIGDGSNMAFRRSAFEVWPGFDENLGRGTVLSGGEEHYAFFTLIERGYRVVYNPLAVVRHPDPSNAEQARRRHLDLVAITTAYITRLAVEHPSCRKALRQYIFDRVRGIARPWTTRAGRASGRIAPRSLTLLAMFSGLGIYLRSRMARKIPYAPRRVPANNFERASVPTVALHDETFPLES